MTNAAQRIITPLAVRWAAQSDVITDWDGDLSVLDNVDGVLVAPATRDIMASHLHGLQHGPLMMELSVALSRGTPIVMIPSMHADLATDPITEDLVKQLTDEGVTIQWGPLQEGKRKTPSSEHITALLAHAVNRHQPQRRSVVITLGATRSSIDDVRHVQNTSSGTTGWTLADDLFRHGHDITCVAGLTTAPAPDWLPLVISTPSPEAMLKECQALSNDRIDAWIHAAAVLDYVVESPAKGKLASQQGPLNVPLIESPKHILELKDACQGAVRIGFKLESGVKQTDLIHRALAQVQRAGMTAVVANRLEDLGRSDKPRAYLVDAQGSHFVLQTPLDLSDAIRTLIERGPGA